MSGTVQFLGLGFLIGIILFFVCERKGLLHKWSGLKTPAEMAKEREAQENEKAS